PYERTTAVVASAEGELEPEPSGSPGELIDLVDVPDVHGATGVTSQRVATTIRQAREARGLTLSDAAKGTRIAERYLRALEAIAPLDEFPAPVYARSFLRAYAEFLDLETDGIVRRFDEDHPVHDDQILEPLPPPRAPPGVPPTPRRPASPAGSMGPIRFTTTRSSSRSPIPGRGGGWSRERWLSPRSSPCCRWRSRDWTAGPNRAQRRPPPPRPPRM